MGVNMQEKEKSLLNEQSKLTYIINEFFGCDAMYYDVNSFDLAQFLLENGVIFREEKQKLKYHIYYEKYNIFYRGYVSYIEIVETDDIYHEVGKIICSSIESVRRISYTKPTAKKSEIERFFAEKGYEKVDDTLWHRPCPKDEDIKK